jgi:hypothetical protein
MARKPVSPGHGSYTWLAKYLSLALTLPASVVAGYIIGRLFGDWLRIDWLPAVGIILGMAGGLTQLLRELSRESKSSDK